MELQSEVHKFGHNAKLSHFSDPITYFCGTYLVTGILSYNVMIILIYYMLALYLRALLVDCVSDHSRVH